jgi:hypothetical protein
MTSGLRSYILLSSKVRKNLYATLTLLSCSYLLMPGHNYLGNEPIITRSYNCNLTVAFLMWLASNLPGCNSALAQPCTLKYKKNRTPE